MGRKKNKNLPGPGKEDQMDNLKWETARDLGLEKDLAESGDELSVVEAGRIGGNMTKKLVEAGEEALEDEGSQALPVPDQDL